VLGVTAICYLDESLGVPLDFFGSTDFKNVIKVMTVAQMIVPRDFSLAASDGPWMFGVEIQPVFIRQSL
jgi:hypothetical protein